MISYDPEHPHFKAALERFQAAVDNRATEKDVIAQVAYNVAHYGVQTQITGIGYVTVHNKPQGFPVCGVVVSNVPEYDIKITPVEQLP
jgi:ribose 5-phosphate isomerase RpiB